MENDTYPIPDTLISIAHTYQIILGCLTFALVLPFVLIPFSRFPLGSTAAVLVGAFLMVTTTVIDQTHVYKVIGDANNLKTIFLLWGMMVISSYFERERLIDYLLNKLFPPGLAFHWWLLRLSIIDSIVAALFTNDVACVILTPLVLKKWIEQERDKYELDTLLLAIATQANIGSTLTIFGNPQMALMASKSNAFVDHHSRLELKTCVQYLWLPTLTVWLLNLLFLIFYYRLNRCRSNRTSPKQTTSETAAVHIVEEQVQTSVVVSQSTPRSTRHTESFRMKRMNESSERASMRTLRPSPAMVDRCVSVASFATLEELAEEYEESLESSRSRPFKIILCALLILVIILLFISNDKIYFDIGLIPVGAAIILIVVDTLINRRSPIFILTRIDWNVLLLFFGLFVWLDGLNSTGIPHWLWVALKLDRATLKDLNSLLLFYIFILIGSNVFSNVPLTLLVLEQVPRTGDHLNLILYLAFITTIAGNLTLFGSVANLIVAQKALASPIKYRFQFWTYFKIDNAQFYPSNSTSQLMIVPNVPSVRACACQCNAYSTCSLANYDGVLQKCSLFSAARWEGKLQLSAISQKNTVIIFTQAYPTNTTLLYTTTTMPLTTMSVSCMPSSTCIATYTTSPTTYQKQMYNYTAVSTGIALLEFGFKAKNPSFTWHLDDVSVIDISALGIEMLLNGNFEMSSLVGWQIVCSSQSCLPSKQSSLVQTNCHNSSNCYEGACQGNYDYLRQYFNVTIRHIYTLSFWLYTDGNIQQEAYVNIS
ncbi:unnamed protein product [Adineta ricciae]|uniref:Citrate transporter-like domain-containing protein n=1 Tax=Adineta ricciae TaxID=249248 RepID=A0A815LYH9_ADIRI|nr:unnamed protein product [Adineta ricciae]